MSKTTTFQWTYRDTGMLQRGKDTAYNELIEDLDSLLTGIGGDADLVAIAAISTFGILCRTAADTWATRTLTQPAAGLTIANPDGTTGNPTFALANDLAALEGLGTSGIPARTGTDTWAIRTLTAPAAGLTITNPGGVAGNPTFALADDLAALEGLASTGFAVRTGASTWVQRSIADGGAGISITNPDGIAGNPTIALADDAAALEALAGVGFATRTGASTWAQRTITGTSGEIDVVNGDGTGGNPTLSLPAVIELTGNNTGVSNTGGLRVKTSDGVNVSFFGDASSGVNDTYVLGYTGEIRLMPNNTGGDTVLVGSGGVYPLTTSAKDLGDSTHTWQHVYAEGIQFPATQVASGNANNLDDYEEGTWTPTLTFATPGDLTVVYSSRIGTYTKVGRTVDYKCNIVTTTFTHTTASGLAIVTGIPFTMSGFSPVAVGLSSGFTIGADFQFGAMLTSAQINLYGWNNSTGAGATNLTTAHLPSGTNKSLYLGGPGHV